MSAKACFRLSWCPVHPFIIPPFIHLSGQILLPCYLVNGLNSFDKTDRKYSPAHTDDLIRFQRSKVRSQQAVYSVKVKSCEHISRTAWAISKLTGNNHRTIFITWLYLGGKKSKVQITSWFKYVVAKASVSLSSSFRYCMRGVQNIRRLTLLITRYARHILSLFTVVSGNWNALGPAFLFTLDSTVEEWLILLFQPALWHAGNIVIH